MRVRLWQHTEYLRPYNTFQGGYRDNAVLGWRNGSTRIPLGVTGLSYGLDICDREITSRDRDVVEFAFKDTAIIRNIEEGKPLRIEHKIPHGAKPFYQGDSYEVFREPWKRTIERKLAGIYDKLLEQARLDQFLKRELDREGLVRIVSEEYEMPVPMIVQKGRVEPPDPDATVAAFMPWEPGKLIVCDTRYTAALERIYTAAQERFGCRVKLEVARRDEHPSTR